MINAQISIRTAFCLAATDVEHLIQGYTVAALSRTFLQADQDFALCSMESLVDHSEAIIEAWARVEFCSILTTPEEVQQLSRLTFWSRDALHAQMQAKNRLFLACLRVHHLSDRTQMQVKEVSADKLGGFIKLPTWLATTDEHPALDRDFFHWQATQLKELKPHPYIEKQQDLFNMDDFDLRHQIIAFLKWKDEQSTKPSAEQQKFIADIVHLGEYSKKLDDGKNNHQIGTDFENIARESLSFLGFTIDEHHKGGAGGLDIYCSSPYPLIVECKAGQKIPSSTTEQLIRIAGTKFQNQEQIFSSSKLIIGPGKPSPDVVRAANTFNVSIMSPNALQKLVKIQTKYPNSINLIELKEFLKPGVIDQRIDQYLEERVLNKLHFHARIIRVIADHLKQNSVSDLSVKQVMKLCNDANFPEQIHDEELHEILIELSSPFAGYLGRKKALDKYWINDRFYYLRDLVIDDTL